VTVQTKTIVTIKCNVCHRKIDTEYETATTEWGVTLQILHAEHDAEEAGWKVNSDADQHVCLDCQKIGINESINLRKQNA